MLLRVLKVNSWVKDLTRISVTKHVIIIYTFIEYQNKKHAFN